MGGCEIPLTDPSVAPLAPNIPFVTITIRDHLRSGGAGFDHLEADNGRPGLSPSGHHSNRIPVSPRSA